MFLEGGRNQFLITITVSHMTLYVWGLLFFLSFYVLYYLFSIWYLVSSFQRLLLFLFTFLFRAWSSYCLFVI